MEKIRFYKYYFKGMPKPIIMEAESKAVAYDMLRQLSFKSQTAIDMKLLEDIRVETPLIGISKRKREGKDWVWIGKENSSNGWILQEEFDKLQKLKQQK